MEFHYFSVNRFDIEGKIKPQIRFGIINNFYINYSERITQIYEDKKEKELRKPDILSLESEKYLIDYYLGTGINYKINDIIDIEFEIVYKDLINEVAPQSDLQIKFYNIGLKTGLRIKIPTHNI